MSVLWNHKMTEDKQPKTDQVKQGKDPISVAPTQQEIKPIEMDPSVSNQTPEENKRHQLNN